MKRIISLILSTVLLLSIIPSAAAEEDYGDNLCLGKTAYMDTIYQNMQGYGPKGANDGKDTTTCATGGNSSDIRSGFQNYVVIDLGDVYELSRVIVRSRRDLDAEWARINFAAYIATKEDFSDAVQVGVKDYAGEFKSDLVVDLDGQVARYVIAANKNKTGGCTISEIEAYGDIYTGPGTGDFTDVEGASKNASKLLHTLGIMTGVSKTDFGPDYLITRAEAAKLICDFANIHVLTEYKGSFADVTKDNPYSGYIQAGLDYGFISADTEYRPDDYIIGYEFIKMVLCVNGYYIMASKGADYPKNIIEAAASINLMDNTDTVGQTYINRKDAAVVLYNALMTSYFAYSDNKFEKSSESFLEKVYKCRLMKGIVTANGVSSIDKPLDNVKNNIIQIDGKEYYDESGTSMKFLGEAVYFLLNEDDNIVTLWIDEKKVHIVEIYDGDIEEADFTKVKTDIDGKNKTYRIDTHPYIILNDVAENDITADDLIPKNGYLKLIDNDNDNVYEIVKIYNPQIMIVDSLNFDEKNNELTVKDEKGNLERLEYEYITVTNFSGKSLSVDKIAKGSLIYLYVSNDGKIVNIEIQESLGIGTIRKISEEYITIDEKEYETTEYFKNNFPRLEIGKSALFFTDKHGRIIYMSDESTTKLSEILAIVQRAVVDETENINDVKIYDEKKNFQELKFAEKVTVNGMRKSLADIEAMGRDYFENQLVLISTNINGEISKIETGSYSEGRIYEQADKDLAGALRGKSGLYKNETFELIIPIKDNIKMFTIPIDENGKPLLSGYENVYNVTPITNVASVRSNVPSSGTFRVYGDAGYGLPVAAVRNITYSSGSSEYSPISKYLDINAMIYTNSTVNIDNNDEMYYSLTGYDIITGKKTTIDLEPSLKRYINTFKIRNTEFAADAPVLPDSSWMTDTKMLNKNKINPYYTNDIDNLKPGDIIRYAKGYYNNYSELELVKKNYEYDVSGCKIIYSAGDLPSGIMSTFALHQALVVDASEGHLTYAFNDMKNQTLDLEMFTDNIIVVEDKTVSSYPISEAGVHLSKGDRIVIFSNAGIYRSIIVYK